MKTKLESLQKRLHEIQSELDSLQGFRQTSKLQQFKRYLVGELNFVKRQISNLQTKKESKEREKQDERKRANINRREKMKRVWRYVKSIQENYAPDKSLKEIRSMLKKQKEGMETEIPDVAWRNPSP